MTKLKTNDETKNGTCIMAEMRKDRTSSDKNKYYWMWREEKKKRQEAEGEMSILKGIENNRVKELEKRIRDLMDRIERLEKDLGIRIVTG